MTSKRVCKNCKFADIIDPGKRPCDPCIRTREHNNSKPWKRPYFVSKAVSEKHPFFGRCHSCEHRDTLWRNPPCNLCKSNSQDQWFSFWSPLPTEPAKKDTAVEHNHWHTKMGKGRKTKTNFREWPRRYWHKPGNQSCTECKFAERATTREPCRSCLERPYFIPQNMVVPTKCDTCKHCAKHGSDDPCRLCSVINDDEEECFWQPRQTKKENYDD